jgi:hypothetical protein
MRTLRTLVANVVQFTLAYLVAVPVYVAVKLVDWLRRQYARRRNARMTTGPR